MTTAVQPTYTGSRQLHKIKSNEVANSAIQPTFTGSRQLHKIKSNEVANSAEAMLGWTDEKVRKFPMEEEEEEWTYPDGGFRAYSVVFACSCLAGVNMGAGLLFGSWLAALHQDIYPDVPLSTLNFIAGAGNFATTATSFFSGRMGDIYGYKFVIGIGCILSIIAQVISAFTYDRLPLIFLFQGVLVGLCLGIAFPSFLSLPSQYFLKHRGLATGLCASGSGFFGGMASLIIKALLPRLGYRGTMLCYAGINTVVYIIAFLIIKVRLPPLKEGETRVPKNWLPKGCWSDPAFYSLTACVAVGVFGYLTPYYYITIYTTVTIPSVLPGSIYSTLPLVLSNFAGGFGRIFAGALADRIGALNSLFLSFFLGGFFQVVMWPNCTSYGSICAFAIFYGLVGSPFLSLLPVAASSLFGLQGLATIVGFIILMNAPAQLLGASISGVVLTSTGGDYSKLGYFSGSMMIAGAIILIPARYSREKRLMAKV